MLSGVNFLKSKRHQHHSYVWLEPLSSDPLKTTHNHQFTYAPHFGKKFKVYY